MTAYDAGSYTSFCIVPAGGMRVCIFDGMNDQEVEVCGIW